MSSEHLWVKTVSLQNVAYLATMASSKTGRAIALAKAYMSGTEELSYVREYSPPEVSTYIDEKKPGVRYLDYDWNAQRAGVSYGSKTRAGRLDLRRAVS